MTEENLKATAIAYYHNNTAFSLTNLKPEISADSCKLLLTKMNNIKNADSYKMCKRTTSKLHF